MDKSYGILPVLLFCLLGDTAWAEDDVLGLLKELKAQVQELKKQVGQSNARISELEKERQQYYAGQQQTGGKPNLAQSPNMPPVAENMSGKMSDKPAVMMGDIKGTFKIPGTDTSVGLGGYVKTDLLLNSVGAGRDRLGDQQLILSQIPVGGAPGEHSQMVFHAKESRLWFKSFTPSSWGDINTYLEMDFYGDPAVYTYTPRVRHVYGSIGNFLAGQAWTTFLNVASLPDILDVGGSAGAVSNLRQPLVRWTQPFLWVGAPMELQMALEAPRSRLWVDNRLEPSSVSGSGNPNSDAYITTPNADRYPDLVTRINFNPDWGNVSLAALGRQVRYSNATGFQKDAWAGSVSLAGKINSIGLDNIRFMTHYGNGSGRYLTTPNTFADAALSSRGSLDLVGAYGAMLSYQHWWDKQWRSSITYGFAQADQPNYVNSVLNRQVQSIHANLLWSPISQAMMGMEYSYATRELLDGRDGDLQRLQFSARYNF
jgi:hypothetical protein